MTPEELRALADAADETARPETFTDVRAVVAWTRANQRLGEVMDSDAARLLAAAADLFQREHADCIGRYNKRLCEVCGWLAIFAGLDMSPPQEGEA